MTAARASRKGPVVGIDLGGTKILAAVVDAAGGILGLAKKRTRPEAGSTAVISRMAACAHKAARSAGIDWGRIAAVGVGSPGPLDPDRGVVIFAPNLDWRNVPLADLLGAALEVPVVIDNDVNVGTLAEARAGAGRGHDDVVGIFVGTGIGGGIIIDGRLHRGFRKNAGEIGHMSLRRKGPLCSCGNCGCLEAYASRPAIVALVRDAVAAGGTTMLTELADSDLERVRSRHLAAAADAGDAVVLRALERAATYLGVAVANLANLLSPEVFVFGGGVIEAAGGHMLPHISEVARERALPGTLDGVDLVAAQLADNAGVIGAAILAREALTGSLPTKASTGPSKG